MPIYIVKPGDCLTKIAADNGFDDGKIIYDHPGNAQFRKKRPNPDVIQAGDELFIPETVPLTYTLRRDAAIGLSSRGRVLACGCMSRMRMANP